MTHRAIAQRTTLLSQKFISFSYYFEMTLLSHVIFISNSIHTTMFVMVRSIEQDPHQVYSNADLYSALTYIETMYQLI
jgi:hypothetical protein